MKTHKFKLGSFEVVCEPYGDLVKMYKLSFGGDEPVVVTLSELKDLSRMFASMTQDVEDEAFNE